MVGTGSRGRICIYNNISLLQDRSSPDGKTGRKAGPTPPHTEKPSSPFGIHGRQLPITPRWVRYVVRISLSCRVSVALWAWYSKTRCAKQTICIEKQIMLCRFLSYSVYLNRRSRLQILPCPPKVNAKFVDYFHIGKMCFNVLTVICHLASPELLSQALIKNC